VNDVDQLVDDLVDGEIEPPAVHASATSVIAGEGMDAQALGGVVLPGA
jgi:hypothetical protein